jgi:hypothetical protein
MGHREVPLSNYDAALELPGDCRTKALRFSRQPTGAGPAVAGASAGAKARAPRRRREQCREVKASGALSRGFLAHVASPCALDLPGSAGRQRQHTICRHARFARVDKRVGALSMRLCRAIGSRRPWTRRPLPRDPRHRHCHRPSSSMHTELQQKCTVTGFAAIANVDASSKR